jgi:Type II secretion system (T2SS), protein N
LKRTLVLTVVAGVLVFLVVLLLALPASWFASYLPPQAQCTDLGGSIWHGECLGLKVQGAPLGDATWNFAAGSALRGKLSGLDTRFTGVGELRNVTLQFTLDPALVPQLPRDQRGKVSANLKRVSLGPNQALNAIDGTIELRDLQQVGANAMELGSYQVTFDGTTQPDGSVVGKVKDLGGPYIVDATLKLAAPNGYLVQGYITGRTAAAESIVREITLGAMPDASGRSQFSFEGSY